MKETIVSGAGRWGLLRPLQVGWDGELVDVHQHGMTIDDMCDKLRSTGYKMRNMSFALTTEQFLDGSKDVTRRNGWLHAQPGQLFVAVEKSQGLKKGQKVRRLGICRIESVEVEKLYLITQEDVYREGFDDMSPADFVAMYCKHNGVEESFPVTRIEFKRMYL